MNQTAVSSATRLSRNAGPVCMHAVGDAAGEVVLEERPGLPHHVPVVLPADAVGDVGGDRLVHQQMLRGGRRPAAANSSTTAMPASSGQDCATAAPGLSWVTRLTTLPMNTGMVTSSSATAKPAANSADEQALGLARKVPIERDQPGRRLVARQAGSSD